MHKLNDIITVGEKLRLIDGPYKGRIFTVIAEDLKDQLIHGRLYCCAEKDVKYGHLYANRREEIGFKQSNHGNTNHTYWINFSSFERASKYKYKFKVGDRVKSVKTGYGTAGDGKETTIVELGEYKNGPGYRVDNPKIGNSARGSYNMCGEDSFELVTSFDETSPRSIEKGMLLSELQDGDSKLVSRKSPVSKGVPLSDLKEGDIVEVLDTENVKYYVANGTNAVGKELIISKEDVEDCIFTHSMMPENNILRTTFRDGDFKILSRDNPVNTKPSLKYKFKVGDRVRVIEIGWGTADLYAETTIVEQGEYSGEPAYKVDHPKIGNSLTGINKGMIGEKTFELVEEEVKKYKISPALGNCAKPSDLYGDVVGEKSFVLVKPRDYLMEERKYEDQYLDDARRLTINSLYGKLATISEKTISKSKEDKYFQEPIKVVKSKTIKQLKLV